jgi:putative restriction endonuclease
MWWENVNKYGKNYSIPVDLYLNILKTHDQRESPSESGKYIKCDVYKVSITGDAEDKQPEILDDKSLKKAKSKMPFGHIDGTKEGQVFASREELGLSGIHSPPMHGIWGRESEGSASIVISGGYSDDIDEGDYILYTGQGGQDAPGGKQIADQEFTRGNKGLQLNKEYNLPVRVTRGYQVEKGPDKGYRYDGIYYVADYERVKGKEGYFICRFHLQKEVVGSPIKDIEHPISPTERVEYTGNRVKRNVSFAEQIKDLYDNTCQVCKVFLKTPIEGVGISEAAHIKAIGSPHDGPDTKANMLCLCPNHHAQFDRYTFYIEPETLEIVGLDEYKGNSISLNKKHKVNVDYFEYQKQQYLQNN